MSLLALADSRRREVFLSSSVREVMPVRSVGNAKFELGPAAAELQHALRRYAGGA